MVNSLEEQEQDVKKVSRLCKPVCVMQIFQQIMDNFVPYSEFKGIEINYFSSCGEKLCVSVFPLFLETVFTNLIDNALKYSVENGIISINIEYDDQKNELIYSVSNFSENILAQNLESLFNFGERGKNIAENIRGLGIGLHLVRRICRLYSGSCQAFCIPIENQSTNQAENPGKNKRESAIKNENAANLCKVVFESRLKLNSCDFENGTFKKFSVQKDYNKILFGKKLFNDKNFDSRLKNLMSKNLILIVEDNIALLKNTSELLKTYCSVVTATNGKDALSKIRENVPDLIVSDMVMPVMGGKAFFDFCQNDENLKNIPFLFLTGVQDITLKNSFIKQGVIDYIFKPFSQEELLMKIYSILYLCVNVRKDFAKTITEFVNEQTASGTHRSVAVGIARPQPQPQTEQKNLQAQTQTWAEEKSLSAQEMRQEYYKIFNLSKREVEIANLLYENYSNKQIAEHLFIAVSTVATHIQHIYEKCNVRNRNEWIRLMSGG